MAEHPRTAHQRLQTSWHAAHHSYWSSSFVLQRHLLRYDTGIESREQLGHDGWCTSMRSCSVYACCGAPPMAEQPGMARQRLQTSWCTVHHSSCSSSVALKPHLLMYDTGIESRGQLVHGGACRCAVEACTHAAVLHRWQSSRARPSSAARPAGTKRISHSGHLASRCSGIYSGTTWASRAVSSSDRWCTSMRS